MTQIKELLRIGLFVIIVLCGASACSNDDGDDELAKDYKLKEVAWIMQDDEIKIIRTKKFDMKPMYPEDACVQMELLGHDFFVFVNAEDDNVNVVYKRKGNTYGLIEPEF